MTQADDNTVKRLFNTPASGAEAALCYWHLLLEQSSLFCCLFKLQSFCIEAAPFKPNLQGRSNPKEWEAYWNPETGLQDATSWDRTVGRNKEVCRRLKNKVHHYKTYHSKYWKQSPCHHRLPLQPCNQYPHICCQRLRHGCSLPQFNDHILIALLQIQLLEVQAWTLWGNHPP